MLFKWEIESLGADSKRSNWTLSPYGIFYYYFFGNYLRSDTDEKVDLGNNERPNVDIVDSVLRTEDHRVQQ